MLKYIRDSLTLTRGSVRLWNNALNGLLDDEEDVVLIRFWPMREVLS